MTTQRAVGESAPIDRVDDGNHPNRLLHDEWSPSCGNAVLSTLSHDSRRRYPKTTAPLNAPRQYFAGGEGSRVISVPDADRALEPAKSLWHGPGFRVGLVKPAPS